MDGDRIVNIVTLDLTRDKLSLEEDLERIINGELPINQKVSEVKTILKKIALIDGATAIWGSQTSNREKKEE